MTGTIRDGYDSDEVTRIKRHVTGPRSGVALALLVVVGVGTSLGCQKGVAGSLDVVAAWPGPVALGATQLGPITDGDSIDLERPLQGGHVLFIGALVRNASGDHGTIRAELRRGETEAGQPLAAPGAIIVFEERSTQLEALPAGATPPSPSPGWKQLHADISDLANLPACPNFLPVQIPDHTLYVQITYTDEKGNTGFATRKIVPRCTQTDATLRNNCLCECRPDYTIERCFVYGDAGTVD